MLCNSHLGINHMIEQLLAVQAKTNFIPTGPGPQEIIVGDTTDGYYGTLTSAEFYTPSELALEVGIKDAGGFPINEDTRWHKVIIDGKVLYHPFLPIRWGCPWDFLNAWSLVYGNKTITKFGKRFKVRLMTGWNPGETPVLQNYPLTGAEKSEFNRIIYRLTSEAPTGSNPNQFAQFTLLELGLHRANLSGMIATRYICQETFIGTGGVNMCLIRNGDNGIAATDQWTASLEANVVGQNQQNGWRPVLELIG